MFKGKKLFKSIEMFFVCSNIILNIILRNCQDGAANINIPVPNGILSLQPTHMTSVDCELASRIDPEVLDQLRMLQSNLNMIVQQAGMRF